MSASTGKSDAWWERATEEPDKPELDRKQIRKLLRMAECLREGENVLEQVLEIKRALRDDDRVYAKALFMELSEYERICVWVAPKFGGIFTTKERRELRE